MTKEQLLKEKENLEYKLSLIDKALNQTSDNGELTFDLQPWKRDILWFIANIIRTSPIVNKNYPHGYDCKICQECGNQCTCDCDGDECNWAFMEYFEKELRKRGFYE